MEDIPEALRQQKLPTKRGKSKSPTKRGKSKSPTKRGKSNLWLLTLLIVVVAGISINFFHHSPSSNTPVLTNTEPIPTPTNTSAPTPKVENLFGHLVYQEAALEQLTPITQDGRIRLRKTAAEQFLQLQADARKEGLNIVCISGFRTVEEQNYLFFKIKELRGQSAATRAKVSAPPGHSEHHTGYAVDIGDANAPATNLSEKFEKTRVFKWMENNAAKYSFELSFPKGNLQGVNYEPWHWRYVGDAASVQTFDKARNLQKPLQ